MMNILINRHIANTKLKNTLYTTVLKSQVAYHLNLSLIFQDTEKTRFSCYLKLDLID